ncbi:MAG TPA: host cell division inhibitor Icd-like protein, partial [Gammaproteobacteria bacterium]|nr:host cell division inhibitor Icd-like protein [Gammaproteobacteria bacterium]
MCAALQFMVGCVGQPSGWPASLLAGTANPSQPAT